MSLKPSDEWGLYRNGNFSGRFANSNIILHDNGQDIVIGRHKDCRITLASRLVSRQHAYLRKNGPQWCIVDLKSLNGIYVNGDKIPSSISYPLKEGDRIGVGVPECEADDHYQFILYKKVKVAKFKAENQQFGADSEILNLSDSEVRLKNNLDQTKPRKGGIRTDDASLQSARYLDETLNSRLTTVGFSNLKSCDASQNSLSKSDGRHNGRHVSNNTLCDADSSQEISSSVKVKEEAVVIEGDSDIEVCVKRGSNTDLSQADCCKDGRTNLNSCDNKPNYQDNDKVSCNEVSSSSPFLAPSSPVIPVDALSSQDTPKMTIMLCSVLITRCDSDTFVLPEGITADLSDLNKMRNETVDKCEISLPKRRTQKRKSNGCENANRKRAKTKLSLSRTSRKAGSSNSRNLVLYDDDDSSDLDFAIVGAKQGRKSCRKTFAVSDNKTSNALLLSSEQIKREGTDKEPCVPKEKTEESKLKDKDLIGYTQDDEIIVISDDDDSFVCSSSTVVKAEPGLPDIDDSVVNDYLPHSLGFEMISENSYSPSPGSAKADDEVEEGKARENGQAFGKSDEKVRNKDQNVFGTLDKHLEDISDDDNAEAVDENDHDFFPVLSQGFFSDGDQSQEEDQMDKKDGDSDENYVPISTKPLKHRISHMSKRTEMIEPLPITFRPRSERGREEWFEERTGRNRSEKSSRKELPGTKKSSVMQKSSKSSKSASGKDGKTKSLKEKIKEKMNHRIPAPGGGSAIPLTGIDPCPQSRSRSSWHKTSTSVGHSSSRSSSDQSRRNLRREKHAETPKRIGESKKTGLVTQRFTSRMEILTKSMCAEVGEKSRNCSELLKSYKIPKRANPAGSSLDEASSNKSKNPASTNFHQLNHGSNKEKHNDASRESVIGQRAPREENRTDAKEVHFKNPDTGTSNCRSSSMRQKKANGKDLAQDMPSTSSDQSKGFSSLGSVKLTENTTACKENSGYSRLGSVECHGVNTVQHTISDGFSSIPSIVTSAEVRMVDPRINPGMPIPVVETCQSIKGILKKPHEKLSGNGNAGTHFIADEVINPRPLMQELPDLSKISLDNIDLEACLRSVAQLSSGNLLPSYLASPSCSSAIPEPTPVDPRIQPRRHQVHFHASNIDTVAPPITKPSKPLSTDKILGSILSWKVQWLKQQMTQTLPPPVVDLKAVVDTKLSYDTFDDYVNTFIPLLFLETWEAVYQSWRECCSRNSHMSCPLAILSCDTRDELAVMSCEALVSPADRMQDNFPQEGHLLIMDLRMNGMENTGYRVFGYVLNSRLESVRYGSSPMHPELKKNLPHSSEMFLLTLQVAAKRKYGNVNMERVISTYVVCYIKPIIRQHEAVMNLHLYPLVRDILRPRTTNCRIPLLLPSSNKARFSGSYNSCQVKAILGTAAAMCRPYPIPQISLIQGPPGTGKTHVLIGIVEQLLMSDSENGQQPMKLLVTAPSNAAVDEITRRLVILKQNLHSLGVKRKIRFVRVGQPSQIHPDVRKYWLDDLVALNLQDQDREELERKKLDISQLEARINSLEHSLDARKSRGAPRSDIEKIEMQLSNAHKTLAILQKERALLKNLNEQELDRRKRQMRNDILQNADVILSTLNSCRQWAVESAFRGANTPFITCCIVDEASQCTEPELLIPLVYGMCKIVLIGDPQQLPATVCSHSALQKNFQRSLMERFMHYFNNTNENPIYVLNEQYRMHPEICNFPSTHFYSGSLFTSHLVEKHVLQMSFPLQPYLIFNIEEGKESNNEPNNIYNMEEALMVLRIIMAVCQTAPDGARLNVITPYQGQRRLFGDLLRKEDLNNVEVSTVDSFQGQESDIVILSCVRAQNISGNIGFIANPQRLNVAITRAKYACYICGHLGSLKVNTHWEQLLQNAAERKLIRSISSDTPFQELRQLILR